MNLSNQDYDLAQEFLNEVLSINEESISEYVVTEQDLQKVRGLVQKKLSDFKDVIDGAEQSLNSFEYEKYADWIFISCLIVLKNFDLRIMESFEIWSKYHKGEMEHIAKIEKFRRNY